jgi:hypothetical protein
MGRASKFLELTASRRILLIEATFWLIAARVILLTVPFRTIAPYLGKFMTKSPKAVASLPEDLIGNISWAVATASRHLPWDCWCLAQALAGKAMLKCRGVPSTLYLGLTKADEAQLQAHAWLRCGELILTGRQGMESYTVVATFAEDRS